MVNYSNGKIYMMEPIVEHDEGDIYIGSTTKKYLSQRLDSHRSQYKRYKQGKTNLTTSFYLFEKYGLENVQICLIEKAPVETKDELFSRESYHIKNLKCLNKFIPNRTQQEYYQDNKSVIKARTKEYAEKNKERCKEYSKEYRNKNKEAIKAKKQTKVECECGVEVCSDKLPRHKRSDKHKKLMEAKQQLPEAEN